MIGPNLPRHAGTHINLHMNMQATYLPRAPQIRHEGGEIGVDFGNELIEIRPPRIFQLLHPHFLRLKLVVTII